MTGAQPGLKTADHTRDVHLPERMPGLVERGESSPSEGYHVSTAVVYLPKQTREQAWVIVS